MLMPYEGTTMAQGSQLTEEQRQEVLRLLRQHRGTISAEIVLDFSADSNTALHTFCWWDKSDSDLARRQRLERARLAIAEITLKQAEVELRRTAAERLAPEMRRLEAEIRRLEEGQARRTFSFAEKRGGTGSSYTDLVLIKKDPDLEAAMRRQLLKELATFVRTRAFLDREFHECCREFLQEMEERFGDKDEDEEESV